ncbi:MAG: uridine kinase [Microbacteriaceae bacterium]|nr:uridine kinase [Microbacteriaceae bacterium]
MARWAPARRDVLEALGAEIAGLYGRGRSIVAIDGPAGHTAEFADDLAEALQLAGHRVLRASVADFHRPRAERDDESAASTYATSYDYSLLRRVLLDPFRTAGSTGVVLAAFDEDSDTAIQPKWITAGPDAFLLIDGEFLLRPELAGLWNYSIWLDPPRADGAEEQSEAHDLYVSQVGPRTASVAIMDMQEPGHPRRVFADSC